MSPIPENDVYREQAPHSLNLAGKCLFCQKFEPPEGRCPARSELQQWGFDV